MLAIILTPPKENIHTLNSGNKVAILGDNTPIVDKNPVKKINIIGFQSSHQFKFLVIIFKGSLFNYIPTGGKPVGSKRYLKLYNNLSFTIHNL
jgi:hypothetical protein